MLKYLAVVAATLMALPAAAQVDTLAKVKERGRLVAGIKVDYRPFGYLDPSGKMVGLEHDLVEDLRVRLEKAVGRAVEIEKITVVAANRIQFMEQGKVDLLIATMTDNEERRKRINIVQPNYYSSGVNVMVRRNVALTDWAELKGKIMCTSQGAFYNKMFAQKYGLELLAFNGIAEAEQALLDGRCFGSLSDDTLIQSRLTDKERWGDFKMPLTTEADAPWGLAVANGDKKMWQFVADTTTDWHRTGFIAELEKKWGLQPSPFIARMHTEYKSK
jgi:polar amino acid transport system substrate-binding protein